MGSDIHRMDQNPYSFSVSLRYLQVYKLLNNKFQIRENLKHITSFEDIHDENAATKQKNLDLDILKWRQLIRQKGYLNELEVECNHVSLSGKELDRELVGFDERCSNNRSLYQAEIKTDKEPGKGENLTPVFTPLARETFHDISKKTKSGIGEMISNAIEEIVGLGRHEEAQNLQTVWQKTENKGTRDEYLTVYKEVVIALEDAS